MKGNNFASDLFNKAEKDYKKTIKNNPEKSPS